MRTNLLYATRHPQTHSTRYNLSEGSPKNSILKYLTMCIPIIELDILSNKKNKR